MGRQLEKENLVNLIINNPEKFNEIKDDETNLSETDFSDLTLSDIDFEDVNLEGVDFREATLTNVNFQNCGMVILPIKKRVSFLDQIILFLTNKIIIHIPSIKVNKYAELIPPFCNLRTGAQQ